MNGDFPVPSSHLELGEAAHCAVHVALDLPRQEPNMDQLLSKAEETAKSICKEHPVEIGEIKHSVEISGPNPVSRAKAGKRTQSAGQSAAVCVAHDVAMPSKTDRFFLVLPL